MNTCTAPPIAANWYLLESCCVDGLGLGQLWQSGSSPVLFKAQIVLNNYESNCLRDWLSQRWKARSLERTTIATKKPGDLINIEVDVLAKYVERMMEKK